MREMLPLMSHNFLFVFPSEINIFFVILNITSVVLRHKTSVLGKKYIGRSVRKTGLLKYFYAKQDYFASAVISM